MKITKEQKQEKLNAIVESAISVFVALGYEKTTFKDIADKMGIARSTIYLYFKDKFELLKACINYQFGQNKELFLKMDFDKYQNQKEALIEILSRLEQISKEQNLKQFIVTIAAQAVHDENIANLWEHEVFSNLKALWQEIGSRLKLTEATSQFYFTIIYSVFFTTNYTSTCFKEQDPMMNFSLFIKLLKEQIESNKLLKMELNHE